MWYLYHLLRMESKCDKAPNWKKSFKDIRVLEMVHLYLFLYNAEDLNGEWVFRDGLKMEFCPQGGRLHSLSFAHRDHTMPMYTGFPRLKENPHWWEFDIDECNIRLETWPFNNAKNSSNLPDKVFRDHMGDSDIELVKKLPKVVYKDKETQQSVRIPQASNSWTPVYSRYGLRDIFVEADGIPFPAGIM
jgi:hypothetical protein